MYFIAGEDVTITIPLKVGGEFVVPDAGSVKYTVKDATGSNLITDHTYGTDENTTQIDITVPAANNGKTMTIEPRFVIVTFKVGGKVYQVREVYKLIDFLLYTAGEDDVRSFMGVSEYELPDSDIDFVKAYYRVMDDYADLATALIDDAKADAANQCVLMQAILGTIDSLQLRLLAAEKDVDKQVRRFAKPDFDAFRATAASFYATSLLALSGAVAGTVPLFSVVTPADPVTGA